MEIVNLLQAQNRQELRYWLEKNHASKKVCWVVTKLGRPKNDTTFWYIDAVEEALCFGWIDSIAKRIDAGPMLAHRLSPRRNVGSPWTELNKERCRRLEKLGLMTDAGRAKLPNMSLKSFHIDADVLKYLHSNPSVWRNFLSFPPLYQRVRIDTIQSRKKRNPELFQKRLQRFFEYTKQGKMYGEWNDNGRLLDY